MQLIHLKWSHSCMWWWFFLILMAYMIHSMIKTPKSNAVDEEHNSLIYGVTSIWLFSHSSCVLTAYFKDISRCEWWLETVEGVQGIRELQKPHGREGCMVSCVMWHCPLVKVTAVCAIQLLSCILVQSCLLSMNIPFSLHLKNPLQWSARALQVLLPPEAPSGSTGSLAR